MAITRQTWWCRRRVHRPVGRVAGQGGRPGRDVVMIDSGRVGEQASGRNGGFCSALADPRCGQRGVDRVRRRARSAAAPRVGQPRCHPICDRPLRIDCLVRARRHLGGGDRTMAADELRHLMDQECSAGGGRHLGSTGTRSGPKWPAPRSRRPTWKRSGEALVDPARLAWGLAAAVERLGGADQRALPDDRPRAVIGRNEWCHAGRLGFGPARGGRRDRCLPVAGSGASRRLSRRY